jgi:hypothetical protein
MKYVFIENISRVQHQSNVPRAPGGPQRLVYGVSGGQG